MIERYSVFLDLPGSHNFGGWVKLRPDLYCPPEDKEELPLHFGRGLFRERLSHVRTHTHRAITAIVAPLGGEAAAVRK